MKPQRPQSNKRDRIDFKTSETASERKIGDHRGGGNSNTIKLLLLSIPLCSLWLILDNTDLL